MAQEVPDRLGLTAHASRFAAPPGRIPMRPYEGPAGWRLLGLAKR